MSADSLRACMGGWCAIRDRCENHHVDAGLVTPAERLCIPGQDGSSALASVRSPRIDPCPLCRADHTLSQCPRWTQRPQEVAQ